MTQPQEGLKKIRLEKGIHLEEVHKKTKIHINILKAIEGDGLTNLSPVYLKGFLKIYCNFLGVDPKDYISEHKEARPQAKPPIVAVKEKKKSSLQEKPQEKPRQKLQEKSQQKPQEKPQLKPQEKPQQKLKERLEILFQKTASYLKIAVEKIRGLKVHAQAIKRGAILVIGLLFVAFVFFNFGKFISSKRKAYLARKKSAPVQTSARRTPRAVKEPGVVAAARGSFAPAAPQPPSTAKKETNSGIRLGLRTRENCWVYVKVDGKVVFQRTLEKGRFESWQAKEKIELSIGNASAVELEVNGQLFSNLGRRGQVLKNILITKEGLNINR
ncbi:MAG: RodZ domain-containing protein [Candidatus Omnitrophota bacterium]